MSPELIPTSLISSRLDRYREPVQPPLRPFDHGIRNSIRETPSAAKKAVRHIPAKASSECVAVATPQLDQPNVQRQGWQPFPLQRFPEMFQTYIQQASQSIQCDQSMLALGLLAALGGSLGRTRLLRLSDTWHERPIVWACLVAPSGGKKSAVMREIKSLLPAVACTFANITIPSLYVKHRDNPRGLIGLQDEITTWLNAKNREWLELHSGDGVTFDRKTGPKEDQHIVLNSTAVSMMGGIQDALLSHLINPKNIGTGLSARFLMVNPPFPKDDCSVGVKVDKTAIKARLKELFDLNFAEGTAETPFELKLSPGSDKIWNNWRHELAKRNLPEASKAIVSKLVGTGARLALILQLAGMPDAREVDERACTDALAITDWFMQESLRIHEIAAVQSLAGEFEKIFSLIARNGGNISCGELIARSRKVHDAGMASKILDRFVEQGRLDRRVIPPTIEGGRPGVRYYLVADHNDPGHGGG